jgi:hypothetical protein
MEAVRANLSREVNTTMRPMLNTYWQVGRTIVEREQNGNLKAQYDKKLLLELSKRQMTELGRGYSHSNLYNMRKLYLQYQKSRWRLENCHGRIIWNFCRYKTQPRERFMSRSVSMRNGQSRR